MRLADIKTHYVGSKNQRVIDMKKTNELGKIVLYEDNTEENAFKEVKVCHA